MTHPVKGIRDEAFQIGTRTTHQFLRSDGDNLYYSTESGPSPLRIGMLRGLLDTLKRKDVRKAIMGYCERWGVPEVCKHGLPVAYDVFHRFHGDKSCLPDEAMRTSPDGARLSESVQSVASIELFAKLLAALIRLGLAFRDGKPVESSDWERAYYAVLHIGLGFEDQHDDRSLIHPFWFEQMIDGMLALSGIRPRLRLLREVAKWKIDIGTSLANNFSGLIVMELVLNLADSAGVCICSGCQTAHWPDRVRSANRGNWCERCKEEGRDQAAASRAYRQREKGKGRSNA